MISTAILISAIGQEFAYNIGSQPFLGYKALAKSSKVRATVYVVQDWNGVDTHEKSVCEKLAAAGYDAYAIDVYGQGIRPKTVKDCSAESDKYYSDPALFLSRLTDAIKQMPARGKSVAIGYCFGGTGVLELARRNIAGIKGVVSFHGGLQPLSKSKPKGSVDVMILHGQADPFVPQDQVVKAITEFDTGYRTFKMEQYPGAVHAFTVKSMGFEVDGAKYNASADSKSWATLMTYLKKVK